MFIFMLPTPFAGHASGASVFRCGELDCLAEAVHGGVDLSFGCRCGRNKAKHAAVAPHREDQAMLEAMLRDGSPFGGRGLFGVSVADEFDADELTAPADVADELVALTQCFQALLHVCADLACL